MFGWIIIIILLYVYHIYLDHPHAISYEYHELAHRYKTGDIILFHALDNINPIFIGSYYGHIGIVYIDPDDDLQIPYIFEAFNATTMPFYPKEYSNGIAISSLEHRLNTYRGYCMYKELKHRISIDIQRGFKEFLQYAMHNMEYNTAIIQNGVNKILWNEELNNGTNCGELVYLSMIKLELLPHEYLLENRKHHLAWLSSVKDVNNNSYFDPVYILSNYFVRPAGIDTKNVA